MSYYLAQAGFIPFILFWKILEWVVVKQVGDPLQRNGLFELAATVGIKENELQLFESYLSDRFHIVYVNHFAM